MYDSLLVPADGSSLGHAELEYGRAIANEYDATVHLIFFQGLPMESPSVPLLPEIAEELRGRAEGTFGEAKSYLEDAGIPTETNVVQGVPADALPAYAEENEVDLIVVGDNGRDWFEKLLLGSKAKRNVRQIETPVLVVGEPSDVS